MIQITEKEHEALMRLVEAARNLGPVRKSQIDDDVSIAKVIEAVGRYDIAFARGLRDAAEQSKAHTPNRE